MDFDDFDFVKKTPLDPPRFGKREERRKWFWRHLCANYVFNKMETQKKNQLKETKPQLIKLIEAFPAFNTESSTVNKIDDDGYRRANRAMEKMKLFAQINYCHNGIYFECAKIQGNCDHISEWKDIGIGPNNMTVGHIIDYYTGTDTQVLNPMKFMTRRILQLCNSRKMYTDRAWYQTSSSSTE